MTGYNVFVYCGNNPINMVDYYGDDPVPLWALHIVNDNANELDYILARNAEASAWAGYARKIVDKAISIAEDYSENDDNILGAAEHHKRGTTNKSNRNKHQQGQARKQRDNFNEKGDARRRPNPNKRRPGGKSKYSIDEKILSTAIVLGASVVIVYVVANDATGIGVVDNAALAPLIPIVVDNAVKVVS